MGTIIFIVIAIVTVSLAVVCCNRIDRYRDTVEAANEAQKEKEPLYADPKTNQRSKGENMPTSDNDKLLLNEFAHDHQLSQKDVDEIESNMPFKTLLFNMIRGEGITGEKARVWRTVYHPFKLRMRQLSTFLGLCSQEFAHNHYGLNPDLFNKIATFYPDQTAERANRGHH